jgi:putative femAB family protein
MLNQEDQSPLLQSKNWQKLQNDLGETTFFEETSKYKFLAIKKKIPFGYYLYLPYGPYLNPAATPEDAKACFKKLISLAKKESAIFIRIEPQKFTNNSPIQMDNLSENQKKLNVAQYFNLNQKLLKKTKDLNPAETWCLDLTSSVPEILTKFSQGTRTRHNNYKKKGLTVEVTKNPEDIRYLVSLQHKLAKERHIASFSERYLKTELSQPFASLYLVRYQTPSATLPTSAKNAQVKNTPEKTDIASSTSIKLEKTNITSSTGAKNALVETPSKDIKSTKPTPKDGEIIAASLFFDYQGTRFYMQSAANLDFKHLPATVALLSHAIFTAKEDGLKTLDFWGIAPENAEASHPWYGFTEFKKSFGGYEKIYAGTFDYLIDSRKYHLYSLLRKINRIKRKIIKTKD